METTLVLLKPDCVQRRLVGDIISRFERKGLNLVAMKMLQVTPELSREHYAEHVSKPFYKNLEEFITSAPIVAMAVEEMSSPEPGGSGSAPCTTSFTGTVSRTSWPSRTTVRAL